MVKSAVSCETLPTNAEKTFLYHEYYIGDKDDEGRKHGNGENHWTGAKSIEWYTGRMVRGTMHGPGEYRWRYSGPDCEYVTYEGQFFNNQMHGYGAMSYPDGRVYVGLYHTNLRWGPGVERHACLRANVGLWRADQLVRLVWRPDAPSVAPDLTSGDLGPAFVEPFRVTLAKHITTIGETNSALELLKREGADPRMAAKNWTKLYPKHCTDLQSPMCQVDVWTNAYYKGKIHSLNENKSPPEFEEKQNEKQEDDNLSANSLDSSKGYYAWNNSPITLEMMKHCYKHEKQRQNARLHLGSILSGPRKHFRPPAEHERDCRTLLMASYLGHIRNVAQLINEHDVYPDITDIKGNTALMYATCGNQDKIIHFLVEAGADVNSLNDSCCTPLGVALMWYLCAEKDVSPKDMLHCLLPRPGPGHHAHKSENEKISEWLINREISNFSNSPIAGLTRGPSIGKRLKSSPSLATQLHKAKESIDRTAAKKSADENYDSDENFCEEKRLYATINREYEIRVRNLFEQPTVAVAQYEFNVRDMIADVVSGAGDVKVISPKGGPKKTLSKNLKSIKPSKEVMWSGVDKEDPASTLTNHEKIKQELLAKIMQTILQLLADGANPSLVRCPQPALVLAISAGNPELIRLLIQHGADVNEVYPKTLNYTALDVAVSLPFTSKNLELVRVLLECGADANHRLKIPEEQLLLLARNSVTDVLGPTLLHAVVARVTESEFEGEIRDLLLQLLLQYHCDPSQKFDGRSAIDSVMSKKLGLLNCLIKSPALMYLNAPINNERQSILVKFFSPPYFLNTSNNGRFPTCYDGDETYANVYVYAKKMLTELTDAVDFISTSKTNGKTMKTKGKAPTKASSKGARSLKNANEEDIVNYTEALQLMTQCGRLFHIRWIQAKLLKELVEVVAKFRHRNWLMIIKEHKNKKKVGLWLTAQRSLEIWDIMKQTRRRVYRDETVFRHMLHIVQFYKKRWSTEKSFSRRMTIAEKEAIEAEINTMIKEHRTGPRLQEIAEEWTMKYVKPELCSINDPKFNICFECALPLQSTEENIICSTCKIVWFCSADCMKNNSERLGHPCTDYLLETTLLTPSLSTNEERRPH